MRAKSLIGFVVGLIAAVALVPSSGAATASARTEGRINVSSRAAVIQYLRSLHVPTDDVVIQRGARNYAGALCPGRGWTCAKTTHTVVQIAGRGGTNSFRCGTGQCRVLQVATAPQAVTQTAACVIRLTAQNQFQACLIFQSSSSANNRAIIYEQANGAGGINESAIVNASITQRAMGATNSNTACVFQGIHLDGSRTVNSGSLAVALAAHQTVSIRQDSANGGNSASNSATSYGTCDSAHPLTQAQTLGSVAKGPGAITQNENSGNSGANVTLDIEQNQSSGFFGVAKGPNSAIFSQTDALTAVANTPHGPVSQTQSSVNGGILGTVNQDSHDASTASATQTEAQCEDAHAVASSSCDHAVPDAPAYSLTQTQFGPVRKGVGTATQTGNGADTFAVNQSSTQDNDTGTGQTNVIQGDCSTAGNCTVTEQTDVDGQATANTQSGQNVNSGITCTGSSCTPVAPPAPSIDAHPPNPNHSSSAEFAFSDTQAGVTFLCQLDGASFSPCSSPQDYFGLADGSHTVSVEAKDSNGNVSPATSYTWVIDTAPVFTTDQSGDVVADNVDVLEFGYGGMRGNGTGSITVAGVGSGTVLRALLYWNGPTDSTDPAANADVFFNSNPVVGTNIGFANNNCWGFQNSQSYMADVTPYVSGDGAYSLDNFVKSGIADINGASLVVFYSDGDNSNNRNLVLWAGNDSNISSSYDAGGWNETLNGVSYPGFGSATLDVVVSDGQSFDDPAIKVNSTALAPDGPIFQGASVPPAVGGGNFWDVESFDITPLLAAGSNTLNIASADPSTLGPSPSNVGWDCLSLVVAAANTPAATPVGPILYAPRQQKPRRAARESAVPTAAESGGRGGILGR